MQEPPKPAKPVFIIDDEASILMSIDTLLRMAEIDNIVTCQDSTAALDLLAQHSASVILLDLNMPRLSGEELLPRIVQEHADVPVIVVTGAVDVQTAVACMKAGAYDYLVKPVEGDRLLTTVQRALRFSELKRENQALKESILSDSLKHPEAFSAIVTRNSKMKSLFRYVEAVAPSPQPVLVTGETGSGKELVAGAVHQLSGRKGPFVPVNVAGLDDNVFSDTLFGHSRGAFTGADRVRQGLIEEAADGTLFLDEIGDLSPDSQKKLLRLLQEGEYLPLGDSKTRRSHCRILAATNRDLWTMERDGSFRRDLNHRLRTHHCHIPPLRDRLDDLPLLTDHFVEKAARAMKRKPLSVPETLVPLLATYGFPGNVRELEAVLFDAVSTSAGNTVSRKGIAEYIKRETGRGDPLPIFPEAPAGDGFPSQLPTLRQAGEQLVAEAMKRAGGNQTRAAGMLGISQQALSKRLKKMES